MNLGILYFKIQSLKLIITIFSAIAFLKLNKNETIKYYIFTVFKVHRLRY